MDNKHESRIFDGNEVFIIPKCSWSDLGIGDSNEIHPVFKVNGKELEYIAIGRFQASLSKDDKALSVKDVFPKTNININEAIQYCKNTGDGWHVITRLEWCAISNWCAMNGFIPCGVTDNITCNKTGVGDSTYSHNHNTDGVYDMCGNVCEWNTGIRLYKGELQVISKDGKFNNDAADINTDISDNSPYWWAIDGTTGELIRPNNIGTTVNSIKISSKGWITSSDSSDYYRNGYDAIYCYDKICRKAKDILLSLGLLKSPYIQYDTNHNMYLFKSNDISMYAGGSFKSKNKDGMFTLSGAPATSKLDNVGFRIAFIKI